ncbi:cystatin-like [Rhinatrema bivittatum]|uniref:cystatin-like n=1 Tax=Rhinatrema bivittatum TaxID=194408 RepID=UPI00112B15C8|nr:cystatin-like [Rhinatrema bivittatum]
MINMWRLSLMFMAILTLTTAAVSEKKRDRPSLGGWKDVNVTDSYVQMAVTFAMDEHNKASNDDYISVASSVIKARQQIVSGIKYALQVQTALTACRKTVFASENCTPSELSKLSQRKKCIFTILFVPWLKTEKLKLLQNSCA